MTACMWRNSLVWTHSSLRPAKGPDRVRYHRPTPPSRHSPAATRSPGKGSRGWERSG